MSIPTFHATTILAVRRDGKVALGGDGQVTTGDIVAKSSAVKVRKLRDGRILAGFAGSVADAFTLFEKFEEKLERYPGNLSKAARMARVDRTTFYRLMERYGLQRDSLTTTPPE